MPKEQSAGAVLFLRERRIIKYLLLHYTSGHWDFPKGHIEKGESEIETVLREVKEETRIEDIKIISGFQQRIRYFFRQYKEKVSEKDRRAGKTPWVFKLVTFYLAETFSQKVVLSMEHKGFIWLEYQEALHKLTYRNAKNILTKAHDFLLKHGFQEQSI